MKRTKTNYRRCTRDISPCSMLSRCNVTVTPLFFSFFFFSLYSLSLYSRDADPHLHGKRPNVSPLDRGSKIKFRNLVAPDFYDCILMDRIMLVVKFFTKCIRKKNDIYIYLNFKICNFSF